jgi:hypothetical protein
MNCFIRMLNMPGVFIGIGIHRDGFDAKLFAGSYDSNGDLAAVSDQNLIEHTYSRFWMK